MTLLAIASCAQYYERRQLQRATWLRYLPASMRYRFFVGRGSAIEMDSDVVVLECGDTYHDLCEKIRMMIDWACEHNYQRMFKLDDDSYLRAQALLDSGLLDYDYVGFIEDRDYARYPFKVYPHAQGGPGYGLSKHSMGLIYTYGVPSMRHQEELAVAQVLFENGIRPRHDTRFVHVHYTGMAVPADFISLHKCDLLKIHKVLYGEKESQTAYRQ